MSCFFFVFFFKFPASAVRHTKQTHSLRTHRQDCRWMRLAQNSTYTLVLLLCKWTIEIIVSSLFFLNFFYLLYMTKKTCLLDRSHITGFPICEPPPLPFHLNPLCIWMKVLRCFKSLVFYMYPSNVRNKGGCVDVIGWVWVRVVCDVVKRAWESVKTHDFSFLFFFLNQMPDG